MDYSIKISKSVQKQIDNLPNAMKGRILEKIKGLEIEPCPSGIVKLKNSEQEHRLRISDYRVRYQIGFFVTWYGLIRWHKSTKSLSGKRFD